MKVLPKSEVIQQVKLVLYGSDASARDDMVNRLVDLACEARLEIEFINMLDEYVSCVEVTPLEHTA